MSKTSTSGLRRHTADNYYDCRCSSNIDRRRGAARRLACPGDGRLNWRLPTDSSLLCCQLPRLRNEPLCLIWDVNPQPTVRQSGTVKNKSLARTGILSYDCLRSKLAVRCYASDAFDSRKSTAARRRLAKWLYTCS